MTHTNCTHCRAPLPAPRSALLRGSVLGLAYVVTFAFVFGYACTGPLGLMVLPFFLPGAIGAITAAHEFASVDGSCPDCGRLVEPEPESVAATPVAAVARA
jgi:hypothetical protein